VRLHQRLVARWANEHGGSAKGWGRVMLAELQPHLLCDDDLPELRRLCRRILPDGWRVFTDEAGKGVLEILEVEVASPLTHDKLDLIYDLYWLLDENEVELRLALIDRFGREERVDLFLASLETQSGAA
jgi:hypothetical protein